ncbi:MAG: hypothetical protein GY731_04430, partial [Gammaproteobacteria bacterium]|nr:hypothetical protein [Gammaproteobacteria bacterium]
MTKDDDASVTQPSKRKLTGGEDPPDESSKVSAQLQELMATARENEEKSRRLHEIELQLVGAPTLKKFLETLFFGYRGIFGLD